MNHVVFSLVEVAGCPTVRIEIDGRALQEWARDVELPFATAEGNAGIAGSYEGLSPDQLNGDRTHFLGTPFATWFDDGDTVLLGCECGEWGCWPLTATISVGDSTVVWDNFRTGHRDWDLRDLGPFSFDRVEYEKALDSVFPDSAG